MTSAAGTRPPCRVFVSYTHDSEQHKMAVQRLCALLDGEADIEVAADFKVKPRIAWGEWARRQILGNDFVIAVASPAYRQAAASTERPPPSHLGIRYEIGFLDEQLTGDRDTWLRRILPVVLPGGKVAEIPEFLLPKSATHYIVPKLTHEGIQELLQVLRAGLGGAGPSAPATGRLSLSPDLEGHWWPAVRGSKIPGAEWFFTGREFAMSEISNFTHAKQRGLCAVTGMPGAGKSALLGALVLRSLRPADLPPTLRAAIPDCGIDAALSAGGKSSRELVTGLADALRLGHLDPERPRESLLARLDEQARAPTVVIDAIDEALLPEHSQYEPADRSSQWRELTELLGDLSYRVRLIIGIRREPARTDDPVAALPQELRSLAPHVIDLDRTDIYLTDDDVARYIARLLRADTREDGYGHDGGWSDEALVDVIGREATVKAHGNFLIAQFIAEELRAMPPVRSRSRGWSATMHWPDRLEGWLAHDVTRRLGRSAAALRDLLAPIALAEQGGLPVDLWLAVAQALQSPKQVTEQDLYQVLRSLWFYVDETGGQSPRYSMRHESFARYFAGPWKTHRAELFYEVLLDSVPTANGSRQWQHVSDYVRVNLLTHARNAGRIESLLIEEPGCLAAADPNSAVIPLTGLTAPRALRTARVFRRAAYILDGGFAERSAALQFHARLLGAADVAQALAPTEPLQDWTVPWRAGGSPGAVPLGGVARASWLLPVTGPRDEPAALIVRPDGRCVLVDAATQARLGPTLAVMPPDADPPDTVTAWVEPTQDVRVALARSEDAITIWTAAGPGASGRPTGSLTLRHAPARLLVIGGPRGLQLMCAADGTDSGLSVWPLGGSGVPLDTPGERVDFLAALKGTAEFGAVVTAARSGTIALWRFRANVSPQAHVVRLGGEVRDMRATGTAQSGCLVVDVGEVRRIFWVTPAGSPTDGGHDIGQGGQLSPMALAGTGSGALAATAGSYGELTVTALRPGRPPRQVARLDLGGPVSNLTFLDAEGALLAAADWTGMINVYATGGPAGVQLVTRLPAGESFGQVVPLGPGQDGAMLATRAIGGLTKFWQIEQPASNDEIIHTVITRVACAGTPDGHGLIATAATGEPDGWAWSPGLDRPVALPHGEPVEQIAIGSNDSSALVCTAGDERFSLWRLNGGRPAGAARTWPTAENLVEHLTVACSGSQQVVCAGGPEFLRLWNVSADGPPRELFTQPDAAVTALAWTAQPGGEICVVAGTDDGLIHVLLVSPQGKLEHTLLDQGEPLTDIAVTPVSAERYLIAGAGRYGTIAILDPAAAPGQARPEPMPLHVTGTRVAWVMDSDRPVLVTVQSAGPVRFWDVPHPKGARLIAEAAAPEGRLHNLATTADGGIACSFTAGSVVFARPGSRPVIARLNCDLAALAWLPGPGWFIGAHGSALIALRPARI